MNALPMKLADLQMAIERLRAVHGEIVLQLPVFCINAESDRTVVATALEVEIITHSCYTNAMELAGFNNHGAKIGVVIS